MTQVIYSHQQLQLKSILRLKQIYAEIGCTVEVADKRCKDAWSSAIISHQSTQVKKVDSQALAQAELDQFIEEQAQAVAPEQLRAVEISFDHHEYYASEKLVATIIHDDDLTQPWVVMVNDVEKHRANTWARCNNYIYWHHKQGTLDEPLPVPTEEYYINTQQSQEQLPPDEPYTTGNEVMAQIFNECEKYGFEILDDGIYSNNDTKLGSVGCTDGNWWFIRVDSQSQQPILCDSPVDAVWWLSRLKNLPTAKSLDQHLQYQTIEQMTPDQLRYLLEAGKLVAA